MSRQNWPQKKALPQDRARRAKVGAHDSVVPCCIEIEEAMRARQTRPGAHDMP